MTPLSRLTLAALLLALPSSAFVEDKANADANASAARMAALAAEAAARVESGQVAEIYGERTRNDAGAGVDSNSPRGTRADANLPGRQLPANFRTTLPSPPQPGSGGEGSAPAERGFFARLTSWGSSAPETPPGKFVDNPGFERAKCEGGESPPCPMSVMMMSENTPHAAKITDYVDYGVIEGNAFVSPRWWEFWKDAKQVSSDEVAQGGVGDCFLLASMAALAVKDPDVLRKMIRQHKTTQATWVNFYDGDPPEPVFVGPVDNLYPVWKPGIKGADGVELGGQSAFAKQIGGPPPPKWPLIIEKAYAIQFRKNSYGDLNNGGQPSDAMTHLTGRPSKEYWVDPTTPWYNQTVDFADLAQWDKDGQPMVIATKHSPSAGCPLGPIDPNAEVGKTICNDPIYDGKVACVEGSVDPVCKTDKFPTLAKGHAYWIKKIDAGTQMVTLANPWVPISPSSSGPGRGFRNLCLPSTLMIKRLNENT